MNQDWILWVIAFHVAAVTIFEILAHWTMVRLVKLRSQEIGEFEIWPDVTIVVAARNEQRDIEPAVRSMLQLDYPNLHLTVVNDRSTDQTGEILDRIASENPRLQVVHIEELPEGWLGKNYALQLGSESSKSEYLLFTDADVTFDPLCLYRAITYAQQQQLDHLTMFPAMPMPSLWLNAFVVFFVRIFFVFFRAWQVNNPRRTASLGLGAFNLIRREVYKSIDGHRRISMEVVDDLLIGQLIKGAGYKQHVLQARDDLSVPWYQSLRELVVGLDKNTFAGVGYNPWLMLLCVFAITVTFLWPFVGVFLTTSTVQWMLGMICIELIGSSAWMAIRLKINPVCALLLPWIVVVFVFTIIRATVLFYVRGGIKWRDTLYTREQLKSNRI